MEDIISVINTLAQNIFSAVDGELFDILDDIAIIDKGILLTEPIEKLSFKSEDSSIILLALSFITMFVICFGIKQLINMYSADNSKHTVKFILRVVICTIFMLSSYFLIETVLDINTLFGDALRNIGEEVTGKDISFITLKELVLEFEKDMTDSAISLDGAIKGLISFGVVSLLFTFAIRYVTVIFLIIIMPIAIMLAINDSTFNIFVKWCKLLFINLFVQNIVIVIITIPLCMEDTDSIIFKVILVGSIYILYKVKTFAGDLLNDFHIKRRDNG